MCQSANTLNILMNAITYILIKPKNLSFEYKGLKFEFKRLKEIESEKIEYAYEDWKNIPYYILQAICEKQHKKGFENLLMGIFYFDNSIEGKDLSTLLDLVLGNWKFYLIPSEKLHDALFRGVAVSINDIESHTKKKDLSIIPLGKLDNDAIRLIKQGIDLLKDNKNKRFKIALHRFSASYKRNDPLDSILDCCSTLEALYNISDELRLKTSLISYHLVKKNKKKTLDIIYEMYGKRNDFVHGNKIPDVCKEEQVEYICCTAAILLSIIELTKIPSSEDLTKKIFEYYAPSHSVPHPKPM